MAVQQLHSPGGQTILSCTAPTTGDWYRVNPKLGNLSFQFVHTASSAGATIASSSVIQVSNDGVNPLATVLGTVGLAGDTLLSDGFTSDQHFEYVRAVVQTCSATSAGAAGTVMGVVCKVSAQMRS